MQLQGITLIQAHELLRERKLSSVELTQSLLNHIERVEPQVKAYVTLTPELALRQAKRADELIAKGDAGPLTGVPMQVKDNLCTKELLTTCSSKMLQAFVPPYSATVVNKLWSHGAVLMGKGNMDEFAMGSSTENSAFFPTHNPWDLDRVPGGSSGGPAASVAAGEAVYSLGSDTGGSIRQPAALCGLVGLKPTYGLVSRYGLVAFASSLDQVGPITWDVSDNALVLQAISGHDPKDSTSIPLPIPDYTKALKQNLNGLRIGIPKEFIDVELDSQIKETITNAASTLEDLGATIYWDISLPHTRYALAVYYIIAPSECSANLARYDGIKYGFSYTDTDSMWEALEKTREYGFGPEVKRRIMLGTYALSSGYYDAYYRKAQQVRTIIKREFDEIFEKVDALISPTSPTPAFRLGERTNDPLQMYLSDVYTIPASIAGIPAISVPAGQIDGLPIGLQIMGKPLGEATLLRIAYAYEQANPWYHMRPALLS